MKKFWKIASYGCLSSIALLLVLVILATLFVGDTPELTVEHAEVKEPPKEVVIEEPPTSPEPEPLKVETPKPELQSIVDATAETIRQKTFGRQPIGEYKPPDTPKTRAQNSKVFSQIKEKGISLFSTPEVLNEYKRNEKWFRGKTIAMRGIVADIGVMDIALEPYVPLSGIFFPLCEFLDEFKDYRGDISIGEEILVVGTVPDEEVIKPQLYLFLYDCAFLSVKHYEEKYGFLPE